MILQRPSFWLLVGVLLLTGAALRAAPPASRRLDDKLEAAGNALSSLPVVAEHKYRMLAKVRPLLFWVGKDNVGGGRISWREDQNGACGLEFLIGSDPLRAPRRINRWGFIAEQVRGSEAHVIGVMKQSKEETIREAESQISSEGSGGHTYQAIHGVSTKSESKATVTSVRVERDLTYRDIVELLRLLGAAPANEPAQSVALPPGTKPGLLFAVRDLVAQSAAFYADEKQRGRAFKLRPIQYVYYRTLYTLSTRSATFLRSANIDGRTYSNLARTDLEITNGTTGARTRFELTFGTTGSLAGIPVHIVYRPRWWLEAQLFLDEETDF